MAWSLRRERKLAAALKARDVAEAGERRANADLAEARKALNTKTAEAVTLRLRLEQQRTAKAQH